MAGTLHRGLRNAWFDVVHGEQAAGLGGHQYRPARSLGPPMTTVQTAPRSGFGATSRRDRWWAKPLLVFLGFSAFVVYSTWAAFQGDHYWLRGTGYPSPV